ncbi:MAG TPA: hypothetical protein VK453_18925 [Micromonosporaceae bacterium]|nr:hypothetical protein [Micromonosporaceae bacterium]
MLTARKAGVWGNRYEVTAAGRTIATWGKVFWKSGGDLNLDGQRYQVRGNVWGSRFGMVDSAGVPVASADRVGRKRWAVEAAGRTYHFQRASAWSSEQELHADGVRIGSVKRVGFWRNEIVVDLPGLPLPVQLFVLGVVITMWDAQAAAAAA